MKLISRNKKAYHDYTVIDEFESGIMLRGLEVKSMRVNACSINESYARIDPARMEIFIYNMTIDNYSHSSEREYDPKRKRKLLLHKHEIRRIKKKLDEKGLTLIPLKVYFNDRNIAKILLGMVKGKRYYDKREQIKRRDFEREQNRIAKHSH